MNNSSIEWTDRTWNPVTGCSKVSEGCRNCYADAMFTRFESKWGKFNDVKCHEDKLQEPFRLEKPQKIFVNSMSDLFHEKVHYGFVDKVMDAIVANPKHIFQILTKRPERMKYYFEYSAKFSNGLPENLWLGVSVEDQKRADERIPILLNIPASVRFLSCEPLLGELNLNKLNTGFPPFNCLTGGFHPISNKQIYRKIDWVIVGGESGPKARPMHPDWVRSLRDQCQAANVPFFFKQWGEWVERPQISELNSSPKGVHYWPDGNVVFKFGKKITGSLLDGIEYKEFPA